MWSMSMKNNNKKIKIYNSNNKKFLKKINKRLLCSKLIIIIQVKIKLILSSKNN